MAKGQKTGGRQKGVPNQKTQEVIDKLKKLKCDPIEGMAKIAMNENNEPALRGQMYKELAQYIAPKRKAIEHTANNDQPLTFVLSKDDAEL